MGMIQRAEKKVQVVVDAATWEPLRLATPKEDFKPGVFQWNHRKVLVAYVPASEAKELPTLERWKEQRKRGVLST